MLPEVRDAAVDSTPIEEDDRTRALFRWMNHMLADRFMAVHCLADLSDGTKWGALMEVTSCKRVPINLYPKFRIHKLENWRINLDFMLHEGLKLVSMTPAALVDGNRTLTLGLIWSYILRIPIQRREPIELPHTYESLLVWVQSIIPACNITNFAKDWSDGRALCCLVNEFSPGAFTLPDDFSPDPLRTVQMGIEKATTLFSIPAMVSAEDFVLRPNPESIAAYLCAFSEYEKATIRSNVIERETARSVSVLMLLEHVPGMRMPKNVLYRLVLWSHTIYEPYVPRKMAVF
jgi:hypothetical protein